LLRLTARNDETGVLRQPLLLSILNSQFPTGLIICMQFFLMLFSGTLLRLVLYQGKVKEIYYRLEMLLSYLLLIFICKEQLYTV
jgi:hypothetical protein